MHLPLASDKKASEFQMVLQNDCCQLTSRVRVARMPTQVILVESQGTAYCNMTDHVRLLMPGMERIPQQTPGKQRVVGHQGQSLRQGRSRHEP